MRIVVRRIHAIAADAALVAERLTQRLAERQCTIFHNVMFVDMRIADAAKIQCEAAMLADLFEHVVEKTQLPVVTSASARRDPGRRERGCASPSYRAGLRRCAAHRKVRARYRSSRPDVSLNPRTPRFAANLRSVSRSPITAESRRLQPSSAR